MNPTQLTCRGRIACVLAALYILLFPVPEVSSEPTSGGSKSAAAESGEERTLRLSMKIAEAKGQDHRKSLYGSVARQRKVRASKNSHRDRTGGSGNRMHITGGPDLPSAR